MFGKGKDGEMERAPQQQASPQASHQQTRPQTTHAAHESSDAVSIISSDMTIVGKIAGEGTVKVFGRVEGELRASTVMIADGAQVEGDLIAEELTVGGSVKGTIHANRVKLNSTAVVEGDIFHRSLAIEENARFEGSSKREETEALRVPLTRQAAASSSTHAPVNGNGTAPSASASAPAHQATS
ncbi:MAG TPA: polymer-forming cytoskeletal protein [Xanthobacteraceae bacterium]|jgi:cytoskeletal protein CcmA (bactofilin family)|nr:polymer-forming cytoskeletal protein [Xanthobacteraceae bacterium]